MKIKYISIFIIFICLTFEVTGQSIADYVKSELKQPQSTSEGIYYEIEGAGNGIQPKEGDYIVVKYVGKLLNGKQFDASPKSEPLVFQLGRRQVIQGWEKGLLFFRKGDTGKLIVPSALAYGKRGVGNVIPENADLMFEITLIDIMDQDGYDDYMKRQEAAARAKFEKEKRNQLETDKVLIANYARKNKFKVNRLPSGLSYCLKKKGKGNLAREGDKIAVEYTGELLDGAIFDSNKDKAPFEFVLGNKKTIPGWEEGLLHFKKGSEGYLFIPSQLAYGPRPIRDEKVNIPGNSVLIFKIKVLKLETPN